MSLTHYCLYVSFDLEDELFDEELMLNEVQDCLSDSGAVYFQANYADVSEDDEATILQEQAHTQVQH